jgi:hypothetical protein
MSGGRSAAEMGSGSPRLGLEGGGSVEGSMRFF